MAEGKEKKYSRLAAELQAVRLPVPVESMGGLSESTMQGLSRALLVSIGRVGRGTRLWRALRSGDIAVWAGCDSSVQRRSVCDLFMFRGGELECSCRSSDEEHSSYTESLNQHALHVAGRVRHQPSLARQRGHSSAALQHDALYSTWSG